MKHTRLLTTVTALFMLALFTGCKSTTTQDGWQHLLQDQSFEGWYLLPDPDLDPWRFEGDVVAGGDPVNGLKKNSFLCSEQEFEDFELQLDFKLTGDPETGLINAGVQYRSYWANNKVTGYQADIGGPTWWGAIYDEHRRNIKLTENNMEALKPHLNVNGWNHYRIRAVGSHHQIYINDILVSDYTEKDESIPTKGFIALQIHFGGPAVVYYRNIKIKEIE